MKFILYFDKSAVIKFAPLYGETYFKFFAKEDQLSNKDTVILKTSNQVFIKSSAFFEILNMIGGPIKILRVLKIVPLKVSDSIYDFIAKNRFRLFGKFDQCPVIPIEIRNRFLP